jgi:hypothetical protein
MRQYFLLLKDRKTKGNSLLVPHVVKKIHEDQEKKSENLPIIQGEIITSGDNSKKLTLLYAVW